MFKMLLNRARIRIAIRPQGPVLVGSGGQTSLDPTRPDLECVRTRHAYVGDTVYLAGSGLKGVLRAQAERILRTLDMRCCDPFDMRSPCQKERDRGPGSGAAYAALCATCRTFGSTRVAGHLAVADAYPWPIGASEEEARQNGAIANLTERRTGVGIDRRTGATRKGVLFEMEVVTAGCFHAELVLRNFQLWQLALVGFVLRDIDQGLVRVGSGKSRGLGRVSAAVEDILIQTARRSGSGRVLRGVGALSASPDEYGLVGGDEMAVPEGLEQDGTGMNPFFDTWSASGQEPAFSLFEAGAAASWEGARSHFALRPQPGNSS